MSGRIPPEALLLNPMRAAVLDLVRAEPGITFLRLVHCIKSLPAFAESAGYGAVLFHVQRLEDGGYVTTRRSGRARRHYANGWGGDASIDALLRQGVGADLARLLLAEPGLSQYACWRRFEGACCRQTVRSALLRLEAYGLVVAGRDGSALTYVPTERLAAHLRLIPRPASSRGPGPPLPPAPFPMPAPVPA